MIGLITPSSMYDSHEDTENSLSHKKQNNLKYSKKKKKSVFSKQVTHLGRYLVKRNENDSLSSIFGKMD